MRGVRYRRRANDRQLKMAVKVADASPSAGGGFVKINKHKIRKIISYYRRSWNFLEFVSYDERPL